MCPTDEKVMVSPGWIIDEKIKPDQKLQQGDLIIFPEEDRLKKAGIVVTADCDLENKKHAGLVTLVPLVDIEVILEYYFLFDDCGTKREQIESYAFGQSEIDQDKNINEKKVLLYKLLSEKKVTSGSPSETAMLFTLDLLDKISIRQYKELMKAIKSQTKSSKGLSDQALKRGDLLILPKLEIGTPVGDVAWVRHIWQYQLNKIVFRSSEAERDQPLAQRVGRLDSPYRYRLTQVMAQVFSDIGLPDFHKDMEKSIKERYDDV